MTNSDIDTLHLERKYVHEVYDSIAESFAESRYAPWPGVMRFLKSLTPGAWGADIGCGNGKYSVAIEKEKLPISPLLASDPSVPLLGLVRKRGYDCIAANLLSLPYRHNSLDYFICIAVLHHLATPERRLEGLKAMSVLLKVGGVGLIQVWAKDQKYGGEAAIYVQRGEGESAAPVEMASIPGGTTLPVQKPRTPFVASNVLLPWNASKITGTKSEDYQQHSALRFYHVFETGELESLIAQVPTLELVESVYEQGNWSATVRKIN